MLTDKASLSIGLVYSKISTSLSCFSSLVTKRSDPLQEKGLSSAANKDGNAPTLQV